MNDFFLWITQIIARLGGAAYVFLFLVMVFESTPLLGLLIPGVTIMLIAGIVASTGALELKTLLIIGSIGAFIGDLMAYYFGYRFSRFYKFHRFLKPEYLKRAESFKERFGNWSVFLGRFIGPLRAMISVVAGMSSMRWPIFAILAALGSSLFVSVHVIVGYFAGSAWQTFESWASRLSLVLLSLAVIAFVLWWLKGFLVRQGRELRNLSASLINEVIAIIFAWRFWKKFQLRFANLSHWFERRLNPHYFKGLPLSTLLVTVLLCWFLTWCIGMSVLDATGFWASFDERIREIVIIFSDYRLAIGAFIITIFGSTDFIIVASASFTFWLLLENRRSYVIGLWTSVLGSLLSATALKFIFAKPRPDPTYYFENFYAFPSVHSTLAVVFFIYFAYYAVKSYPRWSRNVSLVLAASSFVLFIGVTRIYLGVHYPTDVIGGFLLGLAWFIVGVIIQRLLGIEEVPRRLKKTFQIWLLSGIVLLLFGFYVSRSFDGGALKNFYYSLPQITENRQSLDLTKPESWPPVTENLRGGRTRFVSAIIFSTEERLREILEKNYWVKRLQPSTGNLLQSGFNRLLSHKDLQSPLRPRFWRNHANDLTFTKNVSRKDSSDLYILRLWKSSIRQEEIYIAELSINRDLSFSDNPSLEDLLNSAQELLLNDLGQVDISKIESINFKFDSDLDNDKDKEQISVYVVHL